MNPVYAGISDVNSDSGTIVAWLVDDGATVRRGDALAEVETSKAVLEVVAPDDGVVGFVRELGDVVDLRADPIAFLFADEAERAVRLDEARASAQPVPAAATAGAGEATDAARRLAEELGVDLATVVAEGLITTDDVQRAAAALAAAGAPTEPLVGPDGVERVMLFGSGRGATQVLGIFADTDAQQAVGIVDDVPARWGQEVNGVPVVGPPGRLVELFTAGAFDAAICAISTSVKARARFVALCREHGIPMANAIDPSVRISHESVIGTGNVICANVHLGAHTVVGDGNFISAHNSFDHHNVLGDACSTGPGCMASGSVTFGSRVRLGTGIFIEPGLGIGDDVIVASGSTIVQSVAAAHIVKTKVITTVTVPQRG